MDFFRSLNEVRRNSGRLDSWENQQRDKDAQRKAYQAKHAPTPEEIEKAKELGETLINVIDVMDDHSESVAENVETATEGISNLAVLAGGVGSGFLAWNLGIKPANKKIKELAKEFDQDAKHVEFAKTLEEKAKVKLHNGEIIDHSRFDAADLRVSEGFLNRITDDNLKHQALEFNKIWKKSIKGLERKRWIAVATVPVAALSAWVAGNIFTTKLQVDSSRIARFQARRELRDPKAFVNYTPEQIAQAKAELDKHPEKSKKKQKSNLKKGFLPSIRELLKDRDNYNKTKKLRAQKQSIVERPLTDAEILQAKKDQEIIQRVVKHINNEAEKNSEKMEVAANVIMSTFPLVSGAIGWLLTLGFEKSGLIKKWVGKYVEKNGSDEAKTAFNAFKDLDKKDPKYTSAWREFFGEITSVPMNKKQTKKLRESKFFKEINDETKGKKSLKDITKFDKIWRKAKDFLAGGIVHSRWGGKALIGFAATFLATFPSSLIALKLQKNAARAGRYTAKRELEQDPTNFIGYSQEELDEVKDVKNEKPKGSKIKEYALFIPNVLRDYFRYEKYKKSEYKKQQALNIELKKLDVTDEQLRDAKNLQAKVFNTFEKVDDKSQAYSEATEAAIETSQPLVYSAGYLAAISPLIIFGVKAAKGKYTPAKITEKITNFIANATKLQKSKLFKGYLHSVEKHTAVVVNNTDTTSTTAGAILKDINISETPITEIINKGLRNLRTHLSTSFRKMNTHEQNDKLYDIERSIKKYAYQNPYSEESYNKESYRTISRIFSQIRGIDDATAKADVLDLLLMNKSAVQEISPERFKNAMKFVSERMISDKNIESISDLMTGLSELQAGLTQNLLNKPELQAIIKKLPAKDANKIMNFEIPAMSKEDVAGLIQKGLPDKEYYLQLLDYLPQPTIVNLPIRFKDMPQIAESFANIAKGVTSTAKLSDTVAGSKVAQSKMIKLLENLDVLNDPKAGMDRLAKYIESLDDDAYIKLVSKTPIGGWEKPQVVNIIKNLSKVYDNIPKAEVKRIHQALAKQLQENPDKFIEAVKSGKITKIFMTPELQKGLALAGISWVTFTTLMTYAIESWLAEIQLRAGRLGVKTAMDDLQDHRYYANVIPNDSLPAESTPAADSNDLLAKFKK